MTTHPNPQHVMCAPVDQLLDKADLAELFKCCTKTIDNALKRGDLPQPFLLMSMPYWMRSAIFDHVRAASGYSAAEATEPAADDTAAAPTKTKAQPKTTATPGTTQKKAGKFSV